MKALAALLGVGLVVVASVLLWPRLTAMTRGSSGVRKPSVETASTAVGNDSALKAPLTADEQKREELATQRVPFYRMLRADFPDLVVRFGVTESLDTLDLVVSGEEPARITAVVDNAVAPSAAKYGFRRVRFLVANPPHSIEPFRVVAESADDGSGNWNTFLK